MTNKTYCDICDKEIRGYKHVTVRVRFSSMDREELDVHRECIDDIPTKITEILATEDKRR